MRKWQDLAAPDDPESWYAVGGMWPTIRGTYETADSSTSTTVTAVGSASVKYAWAGKTLAGAVREYVVDAAKIWEYSAGTVTDRTGGVTLTSTPMMAQYGDVTIGVFGSATATVKSTGGNFSALAGAPKGRIVCVQSNAVLIFNTDTAVDGWAASDVGDYTNWTTGEAASGRIITTSGEIVAAVSHGSDVYVFKRDAIYRMTYVGGVVKWQIQLAWKGNGAAGIDSILGASVPWYQVISTAHGIVFKGDNFTSTGYDNTIYLFDGASEPKLLNPYTTLPYCYPVLCYAPVFDMLILAPTLGSSGGSARDFAGNIVTSLYYYYSFRTGQWGNGYGAANEITSSSSIVANGVLQGSYYDRSEQVIKPVYWRFDESAGGKFYRCAPSAPASSSSCYLQTSKIGDASGKTSFDRVIPLLRKRTDLGTDSASLEMTLFTEREDTTASTTRTIAESSPRKRFDLKGGVSEDTYARFKVTWTDLDVEVDDFIVKSRFRPDGN